MCTNLYHRTNICASCGRYDERHIGKSSIGWQFSFRGYKPDEWDEDAPTIVSYQDWLAALSEGKIFDEYGEEMSLEDFKALVAAKQSNKNKNHYDECTDEYSRARDWKDAEGHSFSGGEFC